MSPRKMVAGREKVLRLVDMMALEVAEMRTEFERRYLYRWME